MSTHQLPGRPEHVIEQMWPSLPPEIGAIDLYTVPKDAAYPEQYEDAAIGRYDPRQRRLVLAVADGASDAVLSGTWARTLVDQFVASPPGEHGFNDRWLDAARRVFAAGVDYASLPWYAIEKLAHGSFAALLGVDINVRKRRYRVSGVGDVLVLVVTSNGIDVWPKTLRTADAFSNRPDLLGTATPLIGRSRITGYLKFDAVGATFILMSDAIAAWFVHAYEQDPDAAINRLTELDSDEKFTAFVEAARDNHTMRVDDVTLLRVRLR